MAIKKKLLQAAAGIGDSGGIAWTLNDPTIPEYGKFYVGDVDAAPSGVFFKSDGTKMYVTVRAGDAVYEYNLSTAWGVSTASYVQNFSVSAQETNPSDVFFKSDGTKMYVVGFSSDAVNEYNLSTAWDISTASYSQNFSASAQETDPTGLFFKSDGTKMYVVGSTGDDVNEYNLSTAWDISTASYNQNFSVAAQETKPTGLFFKSDGTKMYVTGRTGDDVNEYNLSTAWDVSTASYVQNFSVSAQETNPYGLFFKPDGTKMYVLGTTEDSVFSYTLSTAWDVSTASWDAPEGHYFNVSGQDLAPYGLFFKSDGTKMYVVGASGGAIYEYSLSTAWGVPTASYVQNFSVAAQETTPQGLFFKSDGTKMYVIGSAGDDVNEYELSTSWDISTTSYSQNFSVAAQDNNPSGVSFKSDGTKMYVIGTGGDAVWAYTLSTAWDISTASFPYDYGLFSVAAQETTPQGVFFKSDGTKMYVIGRAGDDVNEYNLSTAWDISTASYSQNFSVSAQETNPTGLFFKSDGTKMYVTGTTGDDVNEYSLSTAWDVSTASYVQNFSVSSQENAPRGVFFKSDGTKMYVVGTSSDAVNEYNLSTAWDISTASYVQNFSVAAQETTPYSSFFKSDGTKMYVIGTSSDAVNEYNLSTAWDVSTASYSQNFSGAAQDINPSDVFFKSDGTRMYVIGTSTDAVFSYTLSTAWDVSTASWDAPESDYFSVFANQQTATDITFKPDGTKMYVIGSSPVSGRTAIEYDLSTAWDVSTSSHVQNFSVFAEDDSPSGVFFKSDGTQMYVIGTSTDAVWVYDLTN